MSLASTESTNPTPANDARTSKVSQSEQTGLLPQNALQSQASSSATDHIKMSRFWCPVRDISLIQNTPNASELIGHALQGNMLMAKNKELLRSLGITHILSLTRQRVPEEIRTVFSYKQIQVSDTPRTEIRHTFEGAFEFIEDARKKLGRVLIHCRAGVSRSSCVSIAYLMWHRKMPLKEAYELVKEKRPIAHPNKGFISQLIAYEKFLFRDAAQGINMNDLAYTIWERTEHLGLNDPLPPMDLCLLNEKKVSEEFVRRFGRKNDFMTMDAGLGGKMGLHMVELYSILDFEWIDDIIRSVLRDYNTQARLALMVTDNSQQQQLQQASNSMSFILQQQQQQQQAAQNQAAAQLARVGSNASTTSNKAFGGGLPTTAGAPPAGMNHYSQPTGSQQRNQFVTLPWPSHHSTAKPGSIHKTSSIHTSSAGGTSGGSEKPSNSNNSKIPGFQGLGLGLFGSLPGNPQPPPTSSSSSQPQGPSATAPTMNQNETSNSSAQPRGQDQQSKPPQVQQQQQHYSVPAMGNVPSPAPQASSSSSSSSRGSNPASVRAVTANANVHR